MLDAARHFNFKNVTLKRIGINNYAVITKTPTFEMNRTLAMKFIP